MVIVAKNDLSKWNRSVTLRNKSDIATLISAYKKCVSMYSSEYIQCVVERDGYYGFVLSDEGDGHFDLFQTINSNFGNNGITVSCANALLLFPETLSRGEYVEQEYQDEGGTGIFEDNEGVPTGLLGEDDDAHYILHVRSNIKLPIGFMNGVVVGRSSSRTDYSVDNSLMSRVHARFYSEDDRYFVEDLGSRNGTFVNNVRVRQNNSIELSGGCTIRLANEVFKFI